MKLTINGFWRRIVERCTPQEEMCVTRYTQFIAENFPTYTCIFQSVLSRFMRLDLSAPKNAILLFRLGKVLVLYIFFKLGNNKHRIYLINKKQKRKWCHFSLETVVKELKIWIEPFLFNLLDVDVCFRYFHNHNY